MRSKEAKLHAESPILLQRVEMAADESRARSSLSELVRRTDTFGIKVVPGLREGSVSARSCCVDDDGIPAAA